jgi:hypothetical protein
VTRSRWVLLATALAVVIAAVVVVLVARSSPSQQRAARSPLPLRAVGELALPGGSSRFDYASLDSGQGLLFVAHLGASEINRGRCAGTPVVRTIRDVAQVHGVIVVPGAMPA